MHSFVVLLFWCIILDSLTKNLLYGLLMGISVL